MKLTKVTSALTALAAAAFISTTAQAAFTYNQGDLILGFEQGNGSGGVTANNYIVDLGAVSQFINATGSLTFNLNTSELTAAFGSGWANNTPSGSTVQWGLIGGSSKTATINVGGVSLNRNTLFYSVGELTTGTQSTPPLTASSSTQGNINTQIQSFALYASGQSGTGNSVTYSSSDSSSWSAFNPSSSAFGGAGNIEQPSSGSFTGPTNSVLDLYQLNNTTQIPGSTAQYLGNFSLASNGTLTFNSIAAVPEPSSIALLLVGFALMVVLVRRNRNNVSVE